MGWGGGQRLLYQAFCQSLVVADVSGAVSRGFRIGCQLRNTPQGGAHIVGTPDIRVQVQATGVVPANLTTNVTLVGNFSLPAALTVASPLPALSGARVAIQVGVVPTGTPVMNGMLMAAADKQWLLLHCCVVRITGWELV